MTAKIKLPTFKNHVNSGPYRSFQKDYADIKLNKKKIGYLVETTLGGKISIWFHVVDSDNKIGWRNVQLKHKGDDMKSTKQWVKDNWKAISELHNICELDV